MAFARTALLLAATLSLSIGEVSAQSRNQRGGAPGDFDLYVLALSWSPGFCELDGDRERNSEQCADGAGLRLHAVEDATARGRDEPARGVVRRGPLGPRRLGRGDASIFLRTGQALRLSRRYRENLAVHLPL